MKKLLLSLLIISALFAACKKKDTTTPSNPSTPAPQSTSVLIPLKIGNVWSFRVIIFDDYYPPTPLDTEYYDLIVDGDSVMGGKTWYTMDIDSDLNYWANASGGVYDSSYGEAGLIYKYPTTVNADYSIDSYGDSAKVLSVNQSVTVPNGTYSCYVYEGHYYGMIYFIDYISQGLGPVKEEGFYSDGNLDDRIELIGHTLN